LAAFLFHAETVGLPMTDDEHYPFLLEIAAETINTVLGHSTVDLAEESNNVILSAPVVIEEARRLHRPKGASFAAISLTTSRGILDMNFIVPKHLFDNKLNIVAC
ncbi:MAG TPA: chemotaxis protein CheX, partial [Telmatospirillum sp.]|nr:chemotaxis protein CheX [Telmatospirillum sp.]